MIVDGGESFNIYEKKNPSFLIRDLITEVSCPLLVIGKEYLPYKKIVFLYDGSTTCMYALKLFGYILPFLNNLKMEILSVNPANGSLHIHDNKLFKEFMKRHHPKADYKVLKGLPEIEIPGYLKKESSNTLVILGAKKRNSISKLFWQSMTDNLLRETTLSLFVVSF